ncbi:ABC transporter ATP-binding protein [Tissierella sp.]|uniref:ABC transporter ATP-binding protein n=1 Tax=Tissierella sp. TaxID=41274 RepID=UPI00285C9710|nr:ABC transporter ATP-binding protein [Tissierella sp.]MDR7856495.1 ABC transporter ATP-binding protein [Tissierella sp.]
MKDILIVENLKKNFGKECIISNLSFSVKEQEIVGFLGPNGSGKSTTLKCICGLYHTNNGHIEINGHSIVNERQQALTHMGVSIEHPTLYPELSGIDHLKMMANWRGIGKQRVQEMVEFSGLGIQIKKVTSKYSMGMKMRLMLALSIMHKPKLVILDEPTNGLDPQAVFNLRRQMEFIRQEGSSILFSSHQLGEVEKIVDRVIFINKGEKLFDGPLPEDLISNAIYSVLVNELKEAIKLINSIPEINLLSFDEKDSWISFSSNEEKVLGKLIMTLSQHNIYILDIRKEHNDLESYYKKVYGDKYDRIN